MKLLSIFSVKLIFNILLIYFTAVVFTMIQSLNKKCKDYMKTYSKPNLYSLYFNRAIYLSTVSVIIIVLCAVNLFMPLTKFFGNLPLLGNFVTIIMLIVLYIYLYFLYELMNKMSSSCEKKLSKFEKFHRDFMLSGTFTIYVLIVIVVIIGFLYF